MFIKMKTSSCHSLLLSILLFVFSGNLTVDRWLGVFLLVSWTSSLLCLEELRVSNRPKIKQSCTLSISIALGSSELDFPACQNHPILYIYKCLSHLYLDCSYCFEAGPCCITVHVCQPYSPVTSATLSPTNKKHMKHQIIYVDKWTIGVICGLLKMSRSVRADLKITQHKGKCGTDQTGRYVCAALCFIFPHLFFLSPVSKTGPKTTLSYCRC